MLFAGDDVPQRHDSDAIELSSENLVRFGRKSETTPFMKVIEATSVNRRFAQSNTQVAI